jgi:hypothetical protein
MDLDEFTWRAVSEQGKILTISSLGEGAGGAVTKCILQGGSTVFALKVPLIFFNFMKTSLGHPTFFQYPLFKIC